MLSWSLIFICSPQRLIIKPDSNIYIFELPQSSNWAGKFKLSNTYNVHSKMLSILYVLNIVIADDNDFLKSLCKDMFIDFRQIRERLM